MRALILFVMLVPSVAAADTPTWSARGGIEQRWMTSSSAVTLTESNLVGWGVSVERRVVSVDVPGPFRPLDVSGVLGIARGTVDGETFDQLENHIGTWAVTAGARARLPLLSWLHLQARGAVGGGKTWVTIADRQMPSIAIADDGRTAVASAAVGLALLPRLSPRERGGFWWGVDAELGYHVATAMTVHAIPEDRPPAELTIPAQYASLGDLDLDGYTLTIAMTMGF